MSIESENQNTAATERLWSHTIGIANRALAVQGTNSAGQRAREEESTGTGVAGVWGELSPGHRLALPCADPIQTGFPTDSAKTKIFVTYHPNKLAFWHQTTAFNYEAERSNDGSWIWKELPD
jgi:hypothetical protein